MISQEGGRCETGRFLEMCGDIGVSLILVGVATKKTEYRNNTARPGASLARNAVAHGVFLL